MRAVALSLVYYERALKRRVRLLSEEVPAVLAPCERKPRGQGMRPSLDREHDVIETYLPLVVGLARAHQTRFISFEDLVQEGNIGLLYAAQTWDASRGATFYSWVRLCVRGRLQKAKIEAATEGGLYGNLGAQGQLLELKKIRREVRLETGETPSEQMLADISGLSLDRVRLLLQQSYPFHRESRPLIKPDTVGEDGLASETWGDDEGAPPESASVDAVDLDEQLILQGELWRMKRAFDNVLSERQRFVLTRRYGLEDDQFRTLSEVGKEMGLSRERTRQIEREALIRLRDQSGIRDLWGMPLPEPASADEYK